MTKFKELCKCFALASLALLCLTLVEVALSVDAAVKTATEEIHSNAMQLRTVIGNAADLINKASGAVDKFSTTAQAVTDTANAQNSAWTENARAMRAMGISARNLLVETNRSLNGCSGVLMSTVGPDGKPQPVPTDCGPGLLPTATAQLQSTTPGIQNFNASMVELHDTLAQVGPPVVEAAMSFKDTGKNVQSATADGANIMHETDAFLHQQYNPAKQTIAHKVLLMILNSIFNGGASGLARR